MKEFDFIEKYLKPLSQNFQGALELKDDVAIIPKDDKCDYIITKDGMAENVHFLPSATPEQIAEKLLRINLSDLAAKGAKPLFYLTFGSLNKKTDVTWVKKFTFALAQVQKEFGIILIGGDTVKTNGDLFFSATLIGEVMKDKALLRKNAKAGDKIFVTGTIGDAEIGLRILRDKLKTDKDLFYIDRHYRPTPRVKIGRDLVGVANASTDVSDGVFASVRNICIASGKRAEVFLNKIPFTYQADEKKRLELAASGDDYELIFTANKNELSKIRHIEAEHKVKITEIGEIKDNNDNSENLTIIGENGQPLEVKSYGFEHKS